MSEPANSIHHLLLTDGMEVEVRGQLVVRGNHLVVTGYRMLQPEPDELPDLHWELTPFVPLELTPDQELTYEDLLGATVYGRGVWSTGAVEVTALTADDSWAVADEFHPEHYRKDFTPVSDDVRSIESGLFASGAMLRRIRLLDDQGPRVLVVATDVEEVQHTLEPIYGDTMEVFRSKWDAWEIRALDDVLNDLSEDKVLKVEFRMNGDGVISRKLRVNYVDDELVRELGRFPDEILYVEAVVEPLGAPRNRDPWYPPHARHAWSADGETPRGE